MPPWYLFVYLTREEYVICAHSVIFLKVVVFRSAKCYLHGKSIFIHLGIKILILENQFHGLPLRFLFHSLISSCKYLHKGRSVFHMFFGGGRQKLWKKSQNKHVFLLFLTIKCLWMLSNFTKLPIQMLDIHFYQNLRHLRSFFCRSSRFYFVFLPSSDQYFHSI